LFLKDFLKMGGLKKRKGEVLFLEGFDVIVLEWLSLIFVCLFLWWGVCEEGTFYMRRNTMINHLCIFMWSWTICFATWKQELLPSFYNWNLNVMWTWLKKGCKPWRLLSTISSTSQSQQQHLQQ
jgi:hypothetical protein